MDALEGAPAPAAAGAPVTREAIEAVIVHEARLMDKLIVNQKRLMSRQDPQQYLHALKEDDGNLAWCCTAPCLSSCS